MFNEKLIVKKSHQTSNKIKFRIILAQKIQIWVYFVIKLEKRRLLAETIFFFDEMHVVFILSEKYNS